MSGMGAPPAAPRRCAEPGQADYIHYAAASPEAATANAAAYARPGAEAPAPKQRDAPDAIQHALSGLAEFRRMREEQTELLRTASGQGASRI